MEPTFRDTVTPDDERAVREIVASTGFFTSAEIDVAVELVHERLTRGAASGYFILLAEMGGQTAGYACYGPIACTVGSFDLYWIAVRRDFQHHGLGRLLMHESEARIAGAAGRRIYIETSSRAQYDPTRRFYERCGYRVEAVLKDFYTPGDDKVVYSKVVGPPVT
jgi:D-alanine-D-alanine ligase